MNMDVIFLMYAQSRPGLYSHITAKEEFTPPEKRARPAVIAFQPQNMHSSVEM